jgi:hypothetical protein
MHLHSAFVFAELGPGETDRHRSMVVESRAYRA